MSTNAEIVQNITSCTSDLLEEFKKNCSLSSESPDEACNDTFRKRIRDHLQHSCYQFFGRNEVSIKNPVRVDFDSNSSFEWINAKAPSLTTEAMSKMIIFEFFTHCCINCVHSINELRQILKELKHERGQVQKGGGTGPSRISTTDFKLISIHSPKFSREQNPESLRAFVEKMSMDHSAVVNDPTRTLWQDLGIFCWPTILVFGPSGPTRKSNELNLLFSLIGEGHGMELKIMLDTSAKYFDEVFDDFDREVALDGTEHLSIDKPLAIAPRSMHSLYYPGKISIFGERLAISDSGNHRIVITSTLDGILQEVIGGSEQGYADGNFLDAKFSNPQGIAFESESVFYVADTGNHAIRRVDLMKKTVSTLIHPNAPISVDDEILTLKSPWDLTFYGPYALIIAAAGNHQIFGYFFESLELFRKLHDKETLDLVAGTGREENRNNSYILKSSFAQPSGISVSNGAGSGKLLFIADSESSSIRMIDGNGKVMGLAGGSRDPMDLFAFGDVDGISYEAKLQHPVGVCASTDGSQVFIADTYNHKVKVIDLNTKRCRTLIGDGTAGDIPGSFTMTELENGDSLESPSPKVNWNSSNSPLALLNEPGGLCLDTTEEFLYIADTNNHKIKIASIKTKTVRSLDLEWHPETVDHGPSVKHPSKLVPLTKLDEMFEVNYYGVAPVTIQLCVKNLPKNYEGGEWTLYASSNGHPACALQSGSVSKSEGNTDGAIIVENIQPTMQEFVIGVRIFLCSKSACYMRGLNFVCHLKHEENCHSNENCPISLVHTPSPTTFQE